MWKAILSDKKYNKNENDLIFSYLLRRPLFHLFIFDCFFPFNLFYIISGVNFCFLFIQQKPYLVEGGFRSWVKNGLRVKMVKPETALTIINEVTLFSALSTN